MYVCFSHLAIMYVCVHPSVLMVIVLDVIIIELLKELLYSQCMSSLTMSSTFSVIFIPLPAAICNGQKAKVV